MGDLGDEHDVVGRGILGDLVFEVPAQAIKRKKRAVPRLYLQK